MKGAVFGLLLANILFACWQYFVMPETVPTNVSFVSELDFSDEDTGDIVLLAEAPEESLRFFAEQLESSVSLSSNQAQPIQVGSTNTCFEIGPFGDLKQAESIVAALTAEFALTMESRELAGEPEYRVYLPPLTRREIATTTLGELRSAFVDNNLQIETFLIPSGELANGIALGLFSEQRNALYVEEQLRNLGYTVTLREESKSTLQYWLVSEPIDSKENFLQLWKEIPGLNLQAKPAEKLCQTIAQETQFP